MTNNQDDKKEKKLTLGGGKLSLNSKSLFQKKVTKNLGNSGQVVVEVTRGKASTGNDLSLNNEVSQKNTSQDDRRLAALQRANSEKEKNKLEPINSLSKLIKINNTQIKTEDKELAQEENNSQTEPSIEKLKIKESAIDQKSKNIIIESAKNSETNDKLVKNIVGEDNSKKDSINNDVVDTKEISKKN